MIGRPNLGRSRAMYQGIGLSGRPHFYTNAGKRGAEKYELRMGQGHRGWAGSCQVKRGRDKYRTKQGKAQGTSSD